MADTPLGAAERAIADRYGPEKPGESHWWTGDNS